MKIFLPLLLLFSLSISSQTKTENIEPIIEVSAYKNFEVFDASIPSDVKTYQKLRLDDKCPNLLDPTIAKDEIKEIGKAWMDLNQKIGNFLAKNNFHWESDASAIKVWHKFYFHKDGTLNKYFFNFITNISQEKKNEYKKLIEEFAKNYKLPLTKESQFAQCGKAAFNN